MRFKRSIRQSFLLLKDFFLGYRQPVTDCQSQHLETENHKFEIFISKNLFEKSIIPSLEGNGG